MRRRPRFPIWRKPEVAERSASVSNEIAAERERRNRIESSLLRARTSIEHGG
jgi:hypothetical protein